MVAYWVHSPKVMGSIPIPATTLLLTGNFYKKDVKHIIPISKKERDYLVSQGVRPGEYGGISRTYSHKKHYFMSNTCHNIKLLTDYRNSIIQEYKEEKNVYAD